MRYLESKDLRILRFLFNEPSCGPFEEEPEPLQGIMRFDSICKLYIKYVQTKEKGRLITWYIGAAALKTKNTKQR
jgi:hypothetical protein